MVNLRGTNGSILKIRSRDRSGRNIHKSQFSTDDTKSVERELRIWKDKLGVPLSAFTNILKKPFDDEELANVKKLMQKDIVESNGKTKKALSK